MIARTPPGLPSRTTGARSLQARWLLLHTAEAQRANDRCRATIELRRAIEADPAFELARADLEAITGTSRKGHGRGQMNWERHHIEVVRTAASGDGKRAADLLREHLAGVGCDPLAFRIVAQVRQLSDVDDDLDNLERQLPGCHLARWPR